MEYQIGTMECGLKTLHAECGVIKVDCEGLTMEQVGLVMKAFEGDAVQVPPRPNTGTVKYV